MSSRVYYNGHTPTSSRCFVADILLNRIPQEVLNPGLISHTVVTAFRRWLRPVWCLKQYALSVAAPRWVHLRECTPLSTMHPNDWFLVYSDMQFGHVASNMVVFNIYTPNIFLLPIAASCRIRYVKSSKVPAIETWDFRFSQRWLWRVLSFGI
jgi:hypothetical protein